MPDDCPVQGSLSLDLIPEFCMNAAQTNSLPAHGDEPSGTPHRLRPTDDATRILPDAEPVKGIDHKTS